MSFFVIVLRLYWDSPGTSLGKLKDEKFKYYGNKLGLYWEYSGNVVGMKPITKKNTIKKYNYKKFKNEK